MSTAQAIRAAIAIRLAVRPSLIALVTISLAVIAAIAAFAQTPSPVTLSGVFDEDLAEIRPDAIGKLQEAAKKANRGGCYPPRATFKALVPVNSGDPLFLTVLANARAEALSAALPSLGLTQDQFKTGGAVEGNTHNVLVTYDKFEPDDDKDPPTLKVTSIPKKGTKVKAGDKIKVTIKASERYEDGHKSWPTGVQLIQLVADDGLVDSKYYGRVPQPCERQTFEVTYTVPRNPPRIVHLTAIAEDGVGNKGSEVGEFPTGDIWKGTMHSEVQASFGPPAYTCSSAFEATLEMIIAGGEISGDGHAAYASSTCNFKAIPRCDSIIFKLQGRVFNDRLEIRFVYGELVPSKCVNMGFGSGYFNGQPLIVPITAPGIAQGQFTSSYNPDAASHYNASDTIHLKCETCAP